MVVRYHFLGEQKYENGAGESLGSLITGCSSAPAPELDGEQQQSTLICFLARAF